MASREPTEQILVQQVVEVERPLLPMGHMKAEAAKEEAKEVAPRPTTSD
jgi:hypothetical protein